MTVVRDAVLSPDVASELMTGVGFLHVPGRPVVNGRAYLFVAIRVTPTLRHFDPERVDYWVTTGAHGTKVSLDRTTPNSAPSLYAWGAIEVVDRKGVTNEFIGFGGSVAVRRYGGLSVAVFSSDAPLAAGGGHSQGWDYGADQMVAFSARLRAAAGSNAAFEERLNGMSETGVYAGFVADALERHQRSGDVFAGDRRLYRLIAREGQRLLTACPDEWEAGAAIAESLSR